MSLIKWMPTHQIEIYGTEYYTKKLPYNVWGATNKKPRYLAGIYFVT